MRKFRHCAIALFIACAPTTASAASLKVIQPVSAHAAAAAIEVRAEHGDAVAEAKLGWLYLNGRGVPQNYYLAAKWFYRAAIHGQGEAQYQLAMLYNKGKGVPRDYTLAYMWLNVSAAQAGGQDGDFKARMRDAIASKMTEDQLRVAQRMAVTWYRSR
jgi:uncharacterized protein